MNTANSQNWKVAVYSSMSPPMRTKPTKRRTTPWTAEWILGFATGVLPLEIFFINADQNGLLIGGGFFYAETQNIPGGCIITPHYPLLELLASGLLFTAMYRVLRLLLSKAF
jgi:hypothetical protein